MTKDEFFRELNELLDELVDKYVKGNKEEKPALEPGDLLKFSDEIVVYLGEGEQDGTIVGASLTERQLFYKEDAEPYGVEVDPTPWEVYGNDIKREQDDE